MENGAKALTIMQKDVNQLNRALSQAVDSGALCRAMAIAARKEMAWPAQLRKLVSKELMIEADIDMEEDGDEEEDDDEGEGESIESSDTHDDKGEAPGEQKLSKSSDETSDSSGAGVLIVPDTSDSSGVLTVPDTSEGGLLIPPDISEGGVLIAPDISEGPFVPSPLEFDSGDLFLNGGNGGVFHDYSEQSKLIAPYSGDLGPLLLDAVVERAKQRQPRVIAIGDVHGCLDELQALLRRCDYRPGDLVIFLGDLVSKGPDSLSVVQMAREMGSIGVRGNHDFEVIRWHQAIMSGEHLITSVPKLCHLTYVFPHL
jgi:hypothetical protein